MLKDEDTGSVVQCPLCGKQYDCEHSLGEMDFTFFDFSPPVSSFIESASDALLSKFNSICYEDRDPKKSNAFLDEDIADLFDWYIDPKGGDRNLDNDILARICFGFLLDQGAIRFDGSIDDSGGPLYSSAIILLFDHNPESFIKKSIQKLKYHVDKL